MGLRDVPIRSLSCQRCQNYSAEKKSATISKTTNDKWSFFKWLISKNARNKAKFKLMKQQVHYMMTWLILGKYYAWLNSTKTTINWIIYESYKNFRKILQNISFSITRFANILYAKHARSQRTLGTFLVPMRELKVSHFVRGTKRNLTNSLNLSHLCLSKIVFNR